MASMVLTISLATFLFIWLLLRILNAIAKSFAKKSTQLRPNNKKGSPQQQPKVVYEQTYFIKSDGTPYISIRNTLPKAVSSDFPKLLIHYRDGSGELTERIISQYTLINNKEIDAYCHLRKAFRTFKLLNIIDAVDVETGEVIQNIWKLFQIHKEGQRETLLSITSHHITTIKALRLFAMTALGFSKANRERERRHIVNYIKMHTNAEAYTDQEIDDWLKKLWCGDYSVYLRGEKSEYEALIKAIPSVQKPDAMTTAYAIVSGSGRKPVPLEIDVRIKKEFG